MKFLIIGGDARTLKLVEMLKTDGHEITTYALDSDEVQSLKNPKDFDAVIGPIPLTKDGKTLNAPFLQYLVLLEELLPYLENQKLIAGPISSDLRKRMEQYNINVIDIMELEELVIYNTIATAEGAIQIAIENTEINLHESKILILGFGKVAKTLAIKLRGLSKHVTCAARKNKDFAWMDTLGFNIENINNLEQSLNQYDIIINTVPQIILTEEKIKSIQEKALIIDLASKPGGIDQEAIKNTNIKYIWALTLPGKIAPVSSAKYIKQAIYNIL